VFGPPVIATQPQSVTVLMGGTATFSVVVKNSPGLSYQEVISKVEKIANLGVKSGIPS
jgi:hypothetical protein